MNLMLRGIVLNSLETFDPEEVLKELSQKASRSWFPIKTVQDLVCVVLVLVVSGGLVYHF